MVSGGETAVEKARHDADAAFVRRDPVAAELLLRNAIKQTHAADALRAWLAEALFFQGDRDGARKVLAEGGFTPDSAGLGLRVKGQVALADGDLGGAGAAFDQALRIVPDDPDLWVAIASLRFTGGEQEQAIEASEKAVVLDPKNPRALALRGLLIREQYGLAASLPWFEAALKNHPDDPPLLDAYASTLGDLGQYRAMLIVCRKLAEVDPKNPRPFLLQAVLAARAGQTNLARSILQRTGTTYRDMPAAMLLSGVLEYQAGNYDSSVGVLERLVRIQPDNRTARHVLARALGAKGDWRRLIDLFDGDVAAGRGDADMAALVGKAWLHLGQPGRGRPILAQALARKGPQVAVPLAADGELSVLASRYGDDPAHAANAVPYIRALMAAHHLDEAQDIADRLRDDNDGNAEVNLLAGDVRMMRGDAAGALLDYTNAAAIRFNEAVLVRMDAALRSAGRKSDADAMTSRFLGQNPSSVTAMTLLAASWAEDPARASDLAALRKAMLARGQDIPL